MQDKQIYATGSKAQGGTDMEYLSETELAEILKISRSTLWELRKTGLPYRQVRGQIRYRLNEVEVWLDENCGVNCEKIFTNKEELTND